MQINVGKYRPLYEDTFRIGYFLQIPIGNDVIHILLISKYSLRDDNFDSNYIIEGNVYFK